MKKNLSLFLLSAMLLACGMNTQAAEQNERGHISLSSTVVKEAEPDIASVVFAVENTADTAQKAAAENNAAADKVIKALKIISSEKMTVMKTSNLSVHPVYHTQNGKRTIKNYTAVNSIKVETKDIKKVPKLIDAAVSNGANRTDSLKYSLQNERAVCSSLYPEIAAELADTAKKLAESSGAVLDGLKYMNVSCITEGASNSRFFAAKALSVSADGVSENSVYEAPVESGKVKIRAGVNAEYYVK